MFVLSAKPLHNIYFLYNMKYYYNLTIFNIFQNVIYSCHGKAELSAAITPVFSVKWSFRNLQICIYSNIRMLYNFLSLLKYTDMKKRQPWHPVQDVPSVHAQIVSVH